MMMTSVFVIIIILLFLIFLIGFGSKPRIIRTLKRQAARWLIAAQQDESPMIATLHVQYGMGYLWALKDIASPNEFFLATGTLWAPFEAKAVAIQDQVSRKVMNACPEFAGDIDRYLGKMAGDI